MAGKNKKKKPGGGSLASNRAAFHEYHILETFEAGIALLGTEVKSIRAGHANLKESYIVVEKGQARLIDCHISPYSHGTAFNHEPTRTRTLLLHKREIRKLADAAVLKGMTIVPLKFYLKGPHIKVEVAIAQGKKFYDKREAKQQQDIKRETDREMKEWR